MFRARVTKVPRSQRSRAHQSEKERKRQSGVCVGDKRERLSSFSSPTLGSEPIRYYRYPLLVSNQSYFASRSGRFRRGTCWRSRTIIFNRCSSIDEASACGGDGHRCQRIAFSFKRFHFISLRSSRVPSANQLQLQNDEPLKADVAHTRAR